MRPQWPTLMAMWTADQGDFKVSPPQSMTLTEMVNSEIKFLICAEFERVKHRLKEKSLR
jgi:hypothetical protein